MSVIGETDESTGGKHRIEVHRVSHLAPPAKVWACVRCGQTLEEIDQACAPGSPCACAG